MLCLVTPRDEVLAVLTEEGEPAVDPLVDGVAVEVVVDEAVAPQPAAPMSTTPMTARVRNGMANRRRIPWLAVRTGPSSGIDRLLGIITIAPSWAHLVGGRTSPH
jgi:hypothetical protein